jgi:hypothetical protein
MGGMFLVNRGNTLRMCSYSTAYEENCTNWFISPGIAIQTHLPVPGDHHDYHQGDLHGDHYHPNHDEYFEAFKARPPHPRDPVYNEHVPQYDNTDLVYKEYNAPQYSKPDVAFKELYSLPPLEDSTSLPTLFYGDTQAPKETNSVVPEAVELRKLLNSSLFVSYVMQEFSLTVKEIQKWNNIIFNVL